VTSSHISLTNDLKMKSKNYKQTSQQNKSEI